MTYWIVFSKNQKWWGHFLKKDFSHVYIIYTDQFGCWAKFDPQEQKLQNPLISAKPSDNYPKMLANDGVRVVKLTKCDRIFRFPKIRSYHLKFGLFFNCVRMCCYFMAIDASKVTPYSFYKQLGRLHDPNCYEERYRRGISSIEVIY